MVSACFHVYIVVGLNRIQKNRKEKLPPLLFSPCGSYSSYFHPYSFLLFFKIILVEDSVSGRNKRSVPQSPQSSFVVHLHFRIPKRENVYLSLEKKIF